MSRDISAPDTAYPAVRAAITQLQAAVRQYREITSPTGSAVKPHNEAIDDLLCEVQRVQSCHQRYMERVASSQIGMAAVPPMR